MDKILNNYSSKQYQFIGYANFENKFKVHKPLVLSKNNMNISSMFEKSSLIFKLIYEIQIGRPIKLIDTDFFFKNKRKIEVIINNKRRNLNDN